MSFLGGIGQFAANAVAPTLNVMAANAQGQREAQQMQQQRMIEQLALQRQQQQLEMQRTYQGSEMDLRQHQGALADQRAKTLAHPPPGYAIKMNSDGSYDLIQVKGDLAGNPESPEGPTTPTTPQLNHDIINPLTQGPNKPFDAGIPSPFTRSMAPPQGGPNIPPGALPVQTPTTGAPNPRVIHTGVRAPAPNTNLAQANGTLNGKDWKGSYDKRTGQYLNLDGTPIPSGSRFTPFAQQTFTPVITTGPNGAQDVSAFGTKSGTVKETGAQAKTGAAGSGQGAQTSLRDMLDKNLQMEQDEQDPQFHIDLTQEAREAAQYGRNQAFTKGTAPPLTTVGMGVAAGAFSKPDERQINYLTNARDLGEETAKAWKGRQNEEAVIRDVTLGKMSSSTLGMPMVRYTIQQRRHNVLAMTALANPTQLSALPPDKQAVISGYIKGLTPDQIAAAQREAQQGSSGVPSATQPTGGKFDPDAFYKQHMSSRPPNGP